MSVRRIDHVGLTVPDLEAASTFLAAAFDAPVIHDIVSEPLAGPEIEGALGLPTGAVVRKVRQVRIGDGATLELFEIASSDQREPVRLCDLGVQHLAVLVDDIHAAVRRATEAGAVLLADPAPLPGPEAGPGRMWVYCQLPWGGLLELVSRP